MFRQPKRRSGFTATNESDDLADDETSSPGDHRARPERNPYLAAHLGLGSDDVDGPLPLALLADSGHLELHADDKVRFDDTLKQAKKKLATAKAKTASTKPRTTTGKVTKAPASRPPTKAKNAKLAGPEPGGVTLAPATAIQDWSRTKPTKAGITEKKAATPDDDDHHVVVELDSDHDAAAIASNNSTRVKRKLEAYLHTEPVRNTVPLYETDGNLSQPLPQRDVRRNEELPSSVYAEEDLYDNLWGAFAPPEGGDVPDYEYIAEEIVAFPDSENLDPEGAKSARCATPAVNNGPDSDIAEAPSHSGVDQVSAGFVLDEGLDDQFDDELEDDALEDVVIDADVISSSKAENAPLRSQAPTVSSSVPAAVSSDLQNITAEGAIPDFAFDEEDLSLEDLEDLEDLELPSSTSTTTRPPEFPSFMAPPSTTPPSSLCKTSTADNTMPSSMSSVAPSSPLPAISRPFIAPILSTPLPIPPIQPDPLSRLPFPRSILDRSPITGLSSHTLLRTCFRLGAALSTGCAAARANRPVLIELYASVLKSERSMETGIQTFVLGDLGRALGVGHANGKGEPNDLGAGRKRPGLTVQAVWQGWKGLEPWQYDGGLLCVSPADKSADANANAKDEGNEAGSTGPAAPFEAKAEAGADEVKMGRFLGKIERDEVGKGWIFRVSNAWEASWEDLEWTRGIYV